MIMGKSYFVFKSHCLWGKKMSSLNLSDVFSKRWQQRYYFGLGHLPVLLAGERVLDNMVGVATAYGLDSLRFEFR
jgi:hypothetical protein